MTGLVPEETPTAALIRRASAIEACSRIAHLALRELRIASGNAPPPAWADLPPEERNRQVLRAELVLSGGAVANPDRFLAAVVRAAAMDLGLGVSDAQAERVDPAQTDPAQTERVDPAQTERLNHIARVTAEVRRTTIGVLLGDRRTRVVATARNLAMLIAHAYFGFSFPVIGRFFGGRHHATVKSNVDSMRNRLLHDEELRATCTQIRAALRTKGPPP